MIGRFSAGRKLVQSESQKCTELSAVRGASCWARMLSTYAAIDHIGRLVANQGRSACSRRGAYRWSNGFADIDRCFASADLLGAALTLVAEGRVCGHHDLENGQGNDHTPRCGSDGFEAGWETLGIGQPHANLVAFSDPLGLATADLETAQRAAVDDDEVAVVVTVGRAAGPKVAKYHARP